MNNETQGRFAPAEIDHHTGLAEAAPADRCCCCDSTSAGGENVVSRRRRVGGYKMCRECRTNDECRMTNEEGNDKGGMTKAEYGQRTRACAGRSGFVISIQFVIVISCFVIVPNLLFAAND